MNGREFERVGNGDAHIAPHAVYPAAGEDRWVAIATATEEQWQDLATAIGREDLADAHPDLAARQANLEAIDAAIAAWTAERDMYEVQETLQAVGVPSHAVQNSQERVVDRSCCVAGTSYSWNTTSSVRPPSRVRASA